MFWTVNFSYPSLEEPKPPTPPPPEPEVTPKPQESSAPVLVNGFPPAEPPTSTTDRLPDIIDSIVTGDTNSEQDLSLKGPATTKAFPQVWYLPW